MNILNNTTSALAVASCLAAIAFSAPLAPAQGLVGNDAMIGSSGNNDTDSEVAYSAELDRYLVVWERRFASGNIDVRARVRNANNGSASSITAITSSPNWIDINPTVCAIRGTDSWLIAWQRGSSVFGPFDIWARRMDANGVLGPAFLATHDGTLVNGTSENEVQPKLVSSQVGSPGGAVLAYEVPAVGIQTRQCTTSVSGAPSTIITGTTISGLSLSAGNSGTHCIAWQGRSGGLDVVRAARINGAGQLVGSTFQTSVAANVRNPAVDGDGNEWLLVFEIDDSNGKWSIGSASLAWDAGGNPIPVGALPNVDPDTSNQRFPAVRWLGHKYLVLYQEEGSFLNYRVEGVAVANDSFATHCGVPFTVDGSRISEHAPAIAVELGGTNVGGRALLTWSSSEIAPPFVADVRGQIYEEWGDNQGVEFAAGCGNPTGLFGGGPFAIGNEDFVFQATSAVSSPQFCLFSFGFTGTTFPCGCTVVAPDFLDVVVMIGGNAQYPLPLPCDATLAGVTLDVQSVVVDFASPVGACSLLPEASFSAPEHWTVGF